VSWAGEVNGHGVTAFTRSNKAGTRFEPIQTARVTWADLFTLSGDGRFGPLDLLMSGTPDSKGSLVEGIYYARLLPELWATIAKNSLKPTNANGSATLTISGSAGDHVTVTITHSGYRSLKTSIKL
jgi:hypothetical protein